MTFAGKISVLPYGMMTPGTVPREPVERVAFPMCEVCAAIVQRMTWFDDPMTRERVFVAHCHGATDEQRVPLFDIASAMPGSIRLGVAFSTRRVSPDPSPP